MRKPKTQLQPVRRLGASVYGGLHPKADDDPVRAVIRRMVKAARDGTDLRLSNGEVRTFVRYLGWG